MPISGQFSRGGIFLHACACILLYYTYLDLADSTRVLGFLFLSFASNKGLDKIFGSLRRPCRHSAAAELRSAFASSTLA